MTIPGDVTRPQRRTAAVLLLSYVGVVALLLWARTLGPGWLGLAGASTLAALLLLLLRGGAAHGPGQRLLTGIGLVLLGAGVLNGARAARELNEVHRAWTAKLGEREAELNDALLEQIGVLVARGERAAVVAGQAAQRARGRQLFIELAALRARADVAALAVFDSTGQLLAWSGEHQGKLPPGLGTGPQLLRFDERPLFSYLYVSTEPDERGRRATAAILLESGWPAEHFHDIGFAGRFAHRHHAQPRFVPPDARAGWYLVSGADTVFGARFEPATQAEWRERIKEGAQRATLVLALLALLALSVAWLRLARGRSASWTGAPLLALAAALAAAPLDAATRWAELFSPALFVLPLPGDPTLGTLLLALLPLGALVASRRTPAHDSRRTRVTIAFGTVVVAFGFVLVLRLLLRGAAPPLLQGGAMLWGALHVGAVLCLALIVGVLLPAQRGTVSRRRTGLLVSGLALGVLLSLAVLARWRAFEDVDAWSAALWAIPYAFVAAGIAPATGPGSLLLRWLCAGWLAATAAVPHLWLGHVDARFRAAERDLATLGTNADPYVDYLLNLFADDIERRAARGEAGQDLMFRSWLASGLAHEALPLDISVWDSAGQPQLSLQLGEARRDRSVYPPQWVFAWLLRRAREESRPIVEAPRNAPGVNQVLATRIAGDRTVLVIVPPRRTLEHSSLLAPLLGDAAHTDAHLTLVPARPGETPPPAGIHWERSPRGWRSEMLLHFPEGDQHAHLELRIPPLGVRFARAALLLSLDLTLLALLWLLGRVARGDPPAFPVVWMRSFRARVTLTLFAFFLLPTIVFGLVAYRSLAGEVERSASVVAERMVGQAMAAFPDSARDMESLATRVGGDVLYYQGGELLAASSPEASELGLYGAWMPAPVYLALRNGEVNTVSQVRQLGRHPYLFAYARALPSGTLAVPMSLEIGEAATRQRELAHLIVFAVVIGGLLSFMLSLLVGRALAEPIGQLRRAASLVGAGKLSMTLPGDREDEFGELFRSFNRMARRLKRARAREKRTARIQAWGEMARQVAHEIKNPLTPIKLSVQHLRRAYSDKRADFDRILDSNVSEILVEIDRLTEIARAFSRFGAPPEAAGPLEEVDAASVARQALTLYRGSEDGIHYEELLDIDVPRVHARAGELKEVLLNLLENARAAVGAAGSIAVSVSMQDDAVELAVSDNGSGIPAELLPRIFEPHFSTRSTGTGLGLAIVRRLVESWGGEVSAESAAGQGTTVRVRMQPVVPAGEDDAPQD